MAQLISFAFPAGPKASVFAYGLSVHSGDLMDVSRQPRRLVMS